MFHFTYFQAAKIIIINRLKYFPAEFFFISGNHTDTSGHRGSILIHILLYDRCFQSEKIPERAFFLSFVSASTI